MSGRSAEIVIVGAGITGLSLALELSRLGVRDVVIVERGYPGSGATGRNVARIRAMQLTEELCRVAGACQAKYERMGSELGFNVLFYRLGYAWILYEEDELAHMREIVAMHHRIGVRSRLLAPKEILEILPALAGGDPVLGGVVHRDAIVHHDAVVWGHLAALEKTAVTLLSGSDVTGIETGSEGVRAVQTTAGRISSPIVVNATDAWSGAVNAMAGIVAPNRPYRREVLVTAPIAPFIDRAVTFYRPTEGWFNQTLRGEVVMGVVDPAEAAGDNQRSSWGFLGRTATLMARKAPALADLTVIRQWAGMYDVTPDHLPLIGPTAQLRGWWQANGWSGRGMLLAPLLMELMARELATGERAAMLDLFQPDRFEGAGAVTENPDYYARYAAG